MAQVKARYKKADAALNQNYRKILEKIPEHRREKFKQDQRDWIGYRDYMAEYQIGFERGNASKETSVLYLAMMADLTESRIPMMKAWVGVKQEDGWTGEYSDGRGGLIILKKEGNKLKFEVSVVRGPTYHIGQIEGVAKINESSARFAEPVDENGKEGAWLTFTQEGEYFIRLDADNAREHHGMRAYFDATYIRTKPVGKFTPKQR